VHDSDFEDDDSLDEVVVLAGPSPAAATAQPGQGGATGRTWWPWCGGRQQQRQYRPKVVATKSKISTGDFSRLFTDFDSFQTIILLLLLLPLPLPRGRRRRLLGLEGLRPGSRVKRTSVGGPGPRRPAKRAPVAGSATRVRPAPGT
jgi:hypothetical protein